MAAYNLKNYFYKRLYFLSVRIQQTECQEAHDGHAVGARGGQLPAPDSQQAAGRRVRRHCHDRLCCRQRHVPGQYPPDTLQHVKLKAGSHQDSSLGWKRVI